MRGEGKKTKALRAAILEVLSAFDGTMSSRQVFYQCVSAVSEHIDAEAWNALRRTETIERESLAMVVNNWDLAVAAVSA